MRNFQKKKSLFTFIFCIFCFYFFILYLFYFQARKKKMFFGGKSPTLNKKFTSPILGLSPPKIFKILRHPQKIVGVPTMLRVVK